MEEMASTTRNNSENSQDASKLMAEANQLVDGSNRSLGDMVVSRRGTAAVARPATTVSSAPRTRLVTFGRRQAPPRLSQQSAEEAIPLRNTGTYGNL